MKSLLNIYSKVLDEQLMIIFIVKSRLECQEGRGDINFSLTI